MKKILILLLFPVCVNAQLMISKPWIKTNLTVIAQANTSGYTLPSYNQRWKQNLVHRKLQDAAVWSELDVLWILANDGDGNYSRINWKDPANFLITLVNSPTFTSNKGYASNGTSSYLNTNWAPSNGTNYTQNNASFFVHTPDNLQGGVAFGTDDNASNTRRLYFQPRSAGDQRAFAVNSAAQIPVTTVTDSRKYVYGERTSSTAGSIFVDDVNTHTITGTSTTRSTRTVVICALRLFDGTIASYYTGNVSSLAFGKVLTTSTKRTALYNAIRDYYISL